MGLNRVSGVTYVNSDSVTRSTFLTDKKQSHSFFAFQVKYFSSPSWTFPNCGLLSHTPQGNICRSMFGQPALLSVTSADPQYNEEKHVGEDLHLPGFTKTGTEASPQKQTSGVRGNDLVTQELILVFSSQPCAHLSSRKLPPSPA